VRFTDQEIVNTHTITSTVDESSKDQHGEWLGHISPWGENPVEELTSATYAITPKDNAFITAVWIDDTLNAGLVDRYTFHHVVATHTITAVFDSAPPAEIFTIHASAETDGGKISPEGEVPVAGGSNVGFTITPEPGHHIEKVIVDGRNVGSVTHYVFNQVSQDGHTIEAYFAEGPPPEEHIITAGVHPDSQATGQITPWGQVPVADGANITFAFTPDEGSRIAAIWIDDTINAGISYDHTFFQVTKDHKIMVEFQPEDPGIITYTITASAEEEGFITPDGYPDGEVKVTQGSNVTFAITPKPNHHIAAVVVDGENIGLVTHFTFNDIQHDDHTIVAHFAAGPPPATHTITSSIHADSEGDGWISPWGETPVEHLSNATFHITPNADSFIRAVWINDSLNAGMISSYTFFHVEDEHSISVEFGELPA